MHRRFLLVVLNKFKVDQAPVFQRADNFILWIGFRIHRLGGGVRAE